MQQANTSPHPYSKILPFIGLLLHIAFRVYSKWIGIIDVSKSNAINRCTFEFIAEIMDIC
jgi:hypothetical protein